MVRFLGPHVWRAFISSTFRQISEVQTRKVDRFLGRHPIPSLIFRYRVHFAKISAEEVVRFLGPNEIRHRKNMHVDRAGRSKCGNSDHQAQVSKIYHKMIDLFRDRMYYRRHAVTQVRAEVHL